MGDFLRIRVQVDIKKPLRRCVLFGNSLGKQPSPCLLRYECLPRFCFFCGMVGHELSTCVVKPTNLAVKKIQYGSWLRVPDPQPRPGSRRRTGIEYFDHDHGPPAPPRHYDTAEAGNGNPALPGQIVVPPAVVDDTVEQAGDAPEAAEFVSTPTVAVNEAAKLDVVTTTLPQAVVEDNQHLEPAMSLSTSLTTPLITEGTASSITLGATFCMPKRSIQGRLNSPTVVAGQPHRAQ
ncbi:hypothetical protein V6N11_056988 [Hibiscus sabdariffa]|uniref:Zinc knuckle CX2CX4HX4C domain-containing protein n=1 Tax=Hibiscus sabdariffa TaxID=183260 RepID=A0ABR2T5T7_9ROSI